MFEPDYGAVTRRTVYRSSSREKVVTEAEVAGCYAIVGLEANGLNVTLHFKMPRCLRLTAMDYPRGKRVGVVVLRETELAGCIAQDHRNFGAPNVEGISVGITAGIRRIEDHINERTEFTCWNTFVQKRNFLQSRNRQARMVQK